MGSKPGNDVKAGAMQKQDEANIPPSPKQNKLHGILRSITVEPIMGIYIMSQYLANLATQNLNLDKACRVNIKYDAEVCDALIIRDTQNYTIEEATVQKMVSGMIAWKTLIQSLIPALLILFWGSWSDRHQRRKPCMWLPLIGEILSVIGVMLCVYFKNTTMEITGLTEVIFPALSGGMFTFLMGTHSFISDITTETERTLRIGIATCCFMVGLPIGTGFSGILLRQIGYYGIFGMCGLLYLICFLYVIFYLREPRKKPKEKTDTSKNVIVDFFDKQHVVETLKVAFQYGPNKRRLRVFFVITLLTLTIGPMHGENSVTYLFARFRFNWSELEFSIFSTFGMVTKLIGVFFTVGLLTQKLKLNDSLVGALASISKMFGTFVYAFAMVAWHMYAGAIAEIISTSTFITMRSMATKLVDKTEQGKVNSLFGVVECFMPMVFVPMYALLYANSLQVLPGAFYLLSCGFTLPVVLIFLWLYCFERRLLRQQQSVVDTKQANNAVEPTVLAEKERHIDTHSAVENAINDLEAGMKDVNLLPCDTKAVPYLKGIDNMVFVADVKSDKLN